MRLRGRGLNGSRPFFFVADDATLSNYVCPLHLGEACFISKTPGNHAIAHPNRNPQFPVLTDIVESCLLNMWLCVAGHLSPRWHRAQPKFDVRVKLKGC